MTAKAFRKGLKTTVKISIDDLARFGMDRVGVQVVITPSDSGGNTLSVQVTTTPYINKDVIAAVQGMVGDGLEDGMLIASAFMTTTGSLSCKGFTQQARSRLTNILGEFIAGYRKILQFQEGTLDDGLRVAARESAQYMLYHEPKDGFNVRLYFVRGDEEVDEIDKQKDGQFIVLLMDQLTNIIDNADFLAWHHERLQKALEPMVIEELKEQIPIEREKLVQRIDSFDRMIYKLFSAEEARTNPAGVRRS